jgi:predicted metal-dependent hydrolase
LCHDLQELYAEINERHFQNTVDARITWGRQPGPNHGRRRSIKLGSYCSREKLIRVHPALDSQVVPRFFVEYIVYHEMLHHVLPPVIRAGRRQLHDRRFKALERAFPDYERALAWERAHIDLLLSP